MREPTTLVTFELQDVPEGTLLTVAESGFEGIPASRRVEAYRGNEQGWSAQMEAIKAYVGQTQARVQEGTPREVGAGIRGSGR